MTGLSNLNSNVLVEAVLNDGREAFAGIEVNPIAIELPQGIRFDEYQYYIHKVGFYLTYTLAWCKQLDLALEFMCNYDYSKRKHYSRVDHLTYNIENYLMRLNSVYDRVLQIVNAVFHLCINEESVGHTVVVSNYKIQHRPEIVNRIKAVQKFIDDYAQARHTLVHKHSWLDLRLRELQSSYANDLRASQQNNEIQQWKYFRANHLRRYLAEKKAEFAKTNTDLASLLENLFTSLFDEYKRQKDRLRQGL